MPLKLTTEHYEEVGNAKFIAVAEGFARVQSEAEDGSVLDSEFQKPVVFITFAIEKSDGFFLRGRGDHFRLVPQHIVLEANQSFRADLDQSVDALIIVPEV